MTEASIEGVEPGATMEFGRWRAFLRYYAALLRFAPRRFALGSLLTLVSTFASGAGLVMVPWMRVSRRVRSWSFIKRPRHLSKVYEGGEAP